MRLDVSMEELFPVPIDRVLHAVTDPRMIERWLMRPDGYEAKVGTRFTLREAPRADCRGEVECEVLELSPPHRIVWSWRGAEDPATTRLVIGLEAGARGTRLTLRHTGVSDEPTIRGTTGGWTHKLGALAELFTTRGGDGND
ncbi:MAG: hypothetical protein NVSMB47_17270 [Polyangiales bacterium]